MDNGMGPCKLCGCETLITYDAEKYPDEEIDRYDPEGFRSNYECTDCHSVFGCTKSSLDPIVVSIYVSDFADTMTLAVKKYLWGMHKVRTRDQLISLALTGSGAAIETLVDRMNSAERQAEDMRRHVETVNHLVRAVKEADDACRDIVYWRGTQPKEEIKRFLDLIFWTKEVNTKL
jgi:hypothetical protein